MNENTAAAGSVRQRVLAVTNGDHPPVGQLLQQVVGRNGDVTQVVYEAEQYTNARGTRSRLGLVGVTADPSEPLDAVLLAPTSATSMGMGRLADMGSRAWAEGVEAPIFAAVEVIQEIRPLLRAPGGCLIMMLPSLSIAGEAGEVGSCTSAEAHRILARSLASTWRSDGVGVHTLLLPTRWFTHGYQGVGPPDGELLGAVRWLIANGRSGHVINLDPDSRTP